MKQLRLFAFVLISVLIIGGVVGPREALSQTQTDELPFKSFLPIIWRTLPPERLGPFGAKVTTVVYHPTNPSIVYAGTWGNGIYKSVNGGTTWAPSSKGLSNLLIQSLAISPSRPNALYAGVYYQANVPSGIFKTIDGGANWFQTGRMINYYDGQPVERPIVYALAIHPWDSDVVYAGSRMANLVPGQDIYGGGGVFKTADGGLSWTPVNNGLPADDLYVYDVAIDPGQPDRVFTAMHESGVYMTENGANSWTCINSNIPHDPYEDVVSSGRAIAINPKYTPRLYYGTWHLQGIFSTTNRGDSWSQTGLEGMKIIYLSIDTLNPNIVYATTHVHGVQITTDQGGDWDAILPDWEGGPGYTRVAIHRTNGQNLLVGTDNGSILRSADRGATWTSSYWGVSGYPVNSMVVDPSNPQILYVSLSGRGIYKSTNRGASWAPVNNGLGDLNVTDVVIDQTAPGTLFAATISGGVYRTTNGAGSWSGVNTGYPAIAGAEILLDSNIPLPAPEREPFDFVESSYQELISEFDVTGLIYTTNLAISPVNTGNLLAGTAGRGIWRYSGGTWSSSSLTAGTVYWVMFDKDNPTVVYAGGAASTGSLLKSTNGGSVWTVSNAGIAGRVVYAITQSSSGKLFAGTDRGVFVSDDHGGTWQVYGLDNQAVVSLLAPSQTSEIVYAGTVSDGYVRRSSEDNWWSIGQGINDFGVLDIIRDPGTSNIFYYGTRLGGVVRINHVP